MLDSIALVVKFSDPSFSNQTTSSPLELSAVATRSISPSPSTSAAETARTLLIVAIVVFVKLSDPSFDK